METSKKEEDDIVEYNSKKLKKAKLQSTLTTLLEDPILADVPKISSLSDVNTLISLELGSAMRISVQKLDSTSFDVAVMNSATVKELKLAIKKKISDAEQSRSMCGKKFVYHIIMRSCLMKMLLFRVLVHFVPCVMSKGSRKHSKRRKHRFFHGLNKRS